MAHRSKNTETVDTVIPTEDLSVLTEDQTIDMLERTLVRLCDHLEQSRVDPDQITAALFNHFSQRLCDANDREQFEMVLEMALDTVWDEHTIH